jgi:hypothetical protein
MELLKNLNAHTSNRVYKRLSMDKLRSAGDHTFRVQSFVTCGRYCANIEQKMRRRIICCSRQSEVSVLKLLFGAHMRKTCLCRHISHNIQLHY